MPLFDPFTTFGDSYDYGGADVFSSAPVVDAPASIGITSELNRQTNQGFFGSLFEGAQDFLGFAGEGLQFVEQFGILPEQDYGNGFLPGGPAYVAPPPASSSIFSAKIGGIPVILLAGGAALWLASR